MTESPPINEVLVAVYDYFLSIGCMGYKDKYDDGHRVFVQLPYSKDRWELDLNGDTLTIRWYQSRWNNANQGMTKKGQTFRVSLADPESLPKAFAHMEKYSRFLRGGTNGPMLKAKAD